MNILLVDDEPLVIQDIAASICWEALGVHRVLLAYSASQAMEEFSKNSIDLIICDVEMPHINGLQLLNWVKEHAPATKSIILTCHPLFDYAKEAIRLNCIDYILKPVDTDALEETLKPVVDDLLRSSPLHTQEIFWRECADNTYSTASALLTAASGYHIPIEGNAYLTVLIRYIRPRNSLDVSVREDRTSAGSEQLDALLHAVMPLFSDITAEHLFFPDSTYNLFGIFLVSPEETAPIKDMVCHRLQDARYGFPGIITALIQESRRLSGAVRAFSLLRSLSLQTSISCIKAADSAVKEKLCLSIDENTVISEIRHRLTRLSPEPSRCKETLLAMRSEIEDWFFTMLSNFDTALPDFLEDKNLLCLRNMALTGQEHFLTWVQTLLDCLTEAAHSTRQVNLAVLRAKEYISDNFQINLTRKDVAKYVFLNADYLDRCFRNELGLSVSQYILQKKLDLAKSQLLHSGKSISDIAAEIGYNNLSSFSYMFKHETGETPMSYRNKK